MTTPSARPLPHVELVHLVRLFQAGRHVEMEDRAAHAVAAHPQDGQAWKALGTARLAQGKEDALAALRQAQALLPQDVEVLGSLGGVLAARGQWAEAVQCHLAAIALRPDAAEAHSNLGDALAGLGDWDGAAASCRQALRLRPGLAAAHCNLGRALAARGETVQAEQCYRRSLDLQPALLQARHGLALALHAQGRLDEAAVALRAVLALRPQHGAALFQLGVVCGEQGRHAEAESAYRQLLADHPGHIEALANLGVTLLEQGRAAAAAEVLQQALRRRPDQPLVHSNLGNAWLAAGRVDEALAAHEAAVAAAPDVALLHGNLAHARLVAGDPARALASLARALALEPERLQWHSEWLFARRYVDMDAEDGLQTLAAARRFGAAARARVMHGPASASGTVGGAGDAASAARKDGVRLRVGLLSGDLRAHPVGWSLLPVLRAWARRPTLELFAYATQPQADAVTHELQACCARWRNVETMDDAAVAAAIRSDTLDVLIDLAGHTRHNRLPVLAWRPAPVQLSWLGSCSTTGMAEVDAVVVDHRIAPPGAEAEFVEPLLRLPSAFLGFDPPGFVDATPVPAPDGVLRLACFNRLAKIGEPVIAAWARILAALPGSTLALQDRALGSAGVCERLRARFATHGVDPARLQLRAAQPRQAYLASYREVDFALDPFPYPGGTTTFEALWMGVPVLTLAGGSALARQGVAIVGALGLDDWVAADVDDYVGRAVAHATDRTALERLKSGLRARLLAAPACDAAALAAALEAALHERLHGRAAA